MTKIQHKRSSVLVSGAAKAPTSAQLDYGELAINYSSTDPQLFIKDSGGSVISILNSYAPLAGATFTGDVNFDGEAIIKGDSTNSGALTLNSETNSKYVKIKAPANSALTSYTLTLPVDDGTSGNVLATDGSGGLSWALSSMSSADAAKLAGIETGATADQTAAEILALLSPELVAAGGLHVTDNLTPTSGSGVEIFKASSTVGQVQAFNRTSSAWMDLVLKGNTQEFHTSGYQRMTITSAGLVGMGTDSPNSYNASADNLVIQNSGGTGSAGMTIRAGTGAQSTIYFADGTATADAIRGYVQYFHNGDFLRFGTDANERLRILSDGKMLLGLTTAIGTDGLQNGGSGNAGNGAFYRFDANDSGPFLQLAKSRNGTVGGNTVVQDGDELGTINFQGADGTDYHSGARIAAFVDGTPGNNDMPGMLVFSVTADGASSPSEKVRIDSSGNLDIANPAGNSYTNGTRISNTGKVASYVSNSTSANDERIYVYNGSTASYKAAIYANGDILANQGTFSGDLTVNAQINNSGTGGNRGAYLGNIKVGYGAYYNSIFMGDGTSNLYLQYSGSGGVNFNYNDSGTVTVGSAGHTVWHAGNDGPSSGLDADTLDGLHGSSYLRSDTDDGSTHALSVKTLTFTGVGGNSNNGAHSYAIYQEPGAWSNPFPDLRIAYHTGISIGANASYGGVRFMNDGAHTNTSELMSVNNASSPIGSGNVYVNNHLHAGTSIRSTIFYDSNDTAYYADPSGRSVQHRLHLKNYAGSSSSGGTNNLEIENNAGTGDANVACLAFHCRSYYGVHMHLRHDGTFGIGGWSASTYRWYVDMNNGNMTAAGNVTAYSDIRLKEEINPLSGCLDKLLGLNGVSFRWKDLPDIVGEPGKKDMGIIAQEIEKVFPEVVHESAHESPDGDKYKTVAYDKLVPVLIEAVKELSVRLTELEAK